MTDEQDKAGEKPVEAKMARGLKIAVVVGAGLVAGLVLLIGVNLISYQRADVCGGDVSQGCITQTSGVISELGREWTETACSYNAGCTNYDLYTLMVAVGDTGTPAELEFAGSRPADLEVGDDVVLETWRSHYVTLTDQGYTINVADWNPKFALVVIAVGLVVAVVASVLWRANLLLFDNDPPAGGMGRLRWSLGLGLLSAGSVLMMGLFIAVIGDHMSLYFRWW